jgi:fatty acid desaturase
MAARYEYPTERQASSDKKVSRPVPSFVWRGRDARIAGLLMLVPIFLAVASFCWASGLGLAGLSRAWPLVLILSVAAIPLVVTLGLARE